MISVLGSACGVTFGRSEEGNDFFTSLDVSGEKVVGSPLTAALAYETFYPVPVDITCELRQGKDLVLEIGRAAISPPAIVTGSTIKTSTRVPIRPVIRNRPSWS